MAARASGASTARAIRVCSSTRATPKAEKAWMRILALISRVRSSSTVARKPAIRNAFNPASGQKGGSRTMAGMQSPNSGGARHSLAPACTGGSASSWWDRALFRLIRTNSYCNSRPVDRLCMGRDSEAPLMEDTPPQHHLGAN